LDKSPALCELANGLPYDITRPNPLSTAGIISWI